MLATDTIAPTAIAWDTGHPRTAPTPRASATDSTMPSGPPTSAIHFTRSRSRRENSMPIENISRTTATSANCSKVRRCVTVGPGVKGPTMTPPTT